MAVKELTPRQLGRAHADEALAEAAERMSGEIMALDVSRLSANDLEYVVAKQERFHAIATRLRETAAAVGEGKQ